MESVELSCEKRQTGSKGLIHALRRQGRIPGIVYGLGSEPAAVSMSASELSARVATEAHRRLIKLTSDWPALDGKHVILKEVQRTPVSGRILHVDLYQVDIGQKIRVEVPLKFVGRAQGVAAGGILQPLERSVEVECLPLNIPSEVEVDVTSLGIHDVIHVSSLKFGSDVKPVFDSDYPIVTVLPPTVAEVAAAAEAPPAVGEAAAGEAAPAGGGGAAQPAETGGAEQSAGQTPSGAAGKAERKQKQ